MKTLDKYRGCLVGGAAGDALGYAVEFVSEESIFSKYGECGITEYELSDGKALISDDTQMTLFTANGLLLHTKDAVEKGICDGYKDYILYSYRCWYATQEGCGDEFDTSRSWLMDVEDLYSRRAPGLTCLSALESGKIGSLKKPANQSKGCGGVMRVAPIGLYLEEENHTMLEIDYIAAESAVLTHGHELGVIPVAAFAHIVHLAVNRENMSLLEMVEEALDAMRELFAKAEYLKEFLDLMNLALDLAESDEDDLDAIHQLGAGWVAEEALAIAVYCAVKYEKDFEKAIVTAVNHGGDSDSTGAITGNILGAYLGLEAIPEKYIKNLEVKETILKMADELFENPEPDLSEVRRKKGARPQATDVFWIK
ncbi:MAG: ADP-ribosylglycohydrolase family protein [Dorea sp.]